MKTRLRKTRKYFHLDDYDFNRLENNLKLTMERKPNEHKLIKHF